MHIFHIVYMIRQNVLQIHASRIDAIAVRKLQISHFTEKQNKSLMRIFKSKGPDRDSCGITLTKSLQSLNVEPILIL